MGMNVKKTMGTICYHVFVCAFGLVMIYPVLWMITGSLKNNTEILNGSLGLIPPNWRWDNYATGWRGFGGVGFGNFFRNSFIVTVISTAAITSASVHRNIFSHSFIYLPLSSRYPSLGMVTRRFCRPIFRRTCWTWVSTVRLSP